MIQYLTFLINKEKVGIRYSSNYILEETHINKVFVDSLGAEYINYKGSKVPVVDTGTLLYNEPLKKFDGLLFVYMDKKAFAYKTEGFFKDTNNVKKEIKLISS